MSLKAEDILGIGSGRFAVDLHNGKVAKIAYSGYGKLANKHEVENYNKLSDKTLVAKTEYVNDSVLLQEKLTDCVTLPWKITDEEVPDYLKHLNGVRLENRLQAGKDSAGRWKIFDFEVTRVSEVGRENWREPPSKEELIAEWEVHKEWHV